MKRHLFWAAPLAALAIAAAAPLGASGADKPTDKAAGKTPSERQCFRTRDVTSFAAADARSLNVRVNHREVYQFEMFGLCNDIDWSQRIAIVSRGSNYICAGVDADIITPSPIGPQRCRARNMRQLTEAEVAALPRLARP